MRNVIFESLNQIAAQLPPEVALRLLTIAMEFSDLPNKDEIADQIRKLTGERDPNKPLTDEEAQQQQQALEQQAEALQMQREAARLALQEQQAKVPDLNAKAAKREPDAAAAGRGGGTAEALGQGPQPAPEETQRESHT